MELLSVSGNIIVIGNPNDDNNVINSGSAFVFQYSDSNGWTQAAKLTASDGAEDDVFGWSVSVSGNTAVVGCYADDDLGFESGSVYIYQYNGTGWTETAKLKASDGAVDDRFGASVSISGNTTVIGSNKDGNLGYESGSAYVFQYNGTGWAKVAKLTASDGAGCDRFGTSVSVSGDTAVIGSYLHDDISFDDDRGTNRGAAYIFQQ